jgi:hypothetical protein
LLEASESWLVEGLTLEVVQAETDAYDLGPNRDYITIDGRQGVHGPQGTPKLFGAAGAKSHSLDALSKCEDIRDLARVSMSPRRAVTEKRHAIARTHQRITGGHIPGEADERNDGQDR